MKLKLSFLNFFISLGFIVLAGISVLSIISATQMRSAMLDDRKDKVQQVILGVNSVIREIIDRQESGELTEEDAKKRILSSVQNFRYDGDNYIFGITYDFCVLAHAKPQNIGGCKKKTQREIFNNLAQKGGGFHEYKTGKAGLEGENFDKVSYVHPIPELNMYIGTGVYFDDINETFTAQLIELGIIGVIIICLIMFIGFYVGKNVSKSLNVLSTRMNDLAKGNVEVEFNFHSFITEIENIINTARIFKVELEKTQALEQEKVELEKKAEEDRRQMTLRLADEFDSSVGQIVKSVSQSASKMDGTATVMNETAIQATNQAVNVAAAADEASRNTATVASATEQLSASIEEISGQVQKAAEVANQAVTESKTANDRVSGLEKAVNKVGQVVTLITDIAEQTNLLALNATIEAARAGEMGKGFAVVASEVKHLANQTAGATDEIAQQISTIQAETKISVSAIESISTTIDSINSISAAIAAAIEEQGAATLEISRSVQEASAGTDQVTQNISGVQRAVEETGQSASEVKVSANDLAEMANDLSVQVETFLGNVRQP